MQRKSPQSSAFSPHHSGVPPIVHDVLRSTGQPLDAATRAFMEPRFDHDFSQVRVHTDARAAESARAVDALAYTVGRGVVFGAGRYAPETQIGKVLLAHELTHIVQQRYVNDDRKEVVHEVGPSDDSFEANARQQTTNFAQDRAVTPTGSVLGSPRLQRSSIGSFLGDLFSVSTGPIQAVKRAFGSEDYSDKELQDYLKKITADGKIEDRYDSDNKARAIVKQWSQGKGDYVLTPRLKILLIREMQSGHTSGADERSILIILRNSTHAELEAIFSAGAIDPKDVNSDFSGSGADELHAFYDEQFEGGSKAVLSGQRKLKPEVLLHMKSPYTWADLKKLVDQRTKRIETTLRGVPEDQRDTVSKDMARSDADDIYQELQKLSPVERHQAIQDLAGERAHQDTVLSDLRFRQGETSDAKATKELEKRGQILEATILMLDLSLEPVYKDIAKAAPKGAKAFGALTTPLAAGQKKKAQEAIKPITKESVAAEMGGVPPPAPKFEKQIMGEKITYEDKIEARAPKMIDESYQSQAAPRGEKEHSDPAKVHKLSELEEIANASKRETDLVFGNFTTAPAFKADKFNATGKLTSKGNIHDVWQSEQAKLKSDPAYKKSSANFWMFYLLQNDGEIKSINYKHNASPAFDDANKPLNDEAKSMSRVGDKYVKSDAQRLFEIGRGWDAFNTSGEVSIQLFKNPDATQDRVFLWDMFFTLIHEYLHSLAHSNYNAYANKLGGEQSTEGNTLIEGVDSLLTETAWTNVKPRAPLPEVRKSVEPEAVKAGEPFDASLLPEMPHRRYDTYQNAIKLVAVVGSHNLYAAYFYGEVKLIGGK
jgi:hypothetical protein